MWKYIKVSLVLFLTAVICALGVAGVNYLTAPRIEEYKTEQKLKAYKEIFADMDASKSEIISDGFKSGYIKEKVVVRSADKDLGYAFNASGKNTYGPITLVVGFDPEGNLLDIVIIENGQTGGRGEMIKNWVESTFVSGMTPTQIDKAPVHAGATIGSNLVKSLLNACLAELGIKTEIQEELESYFGESVDMSKSVQKTALVYPQQLKDFYTVKNSNSEVLGYYAKYNGTVVALNAEFTAISENVPANATDLIKAEAENKLDEVAFVKAILTKDPVLADAEFDKEKFPRVDKYQTISKGEEVVGKLVKVIGGVNVPQTDNATIGLVLVFDNNSKLQGVAIYENNQTAGRAEKVSQFVASGFADGMTGTEAMSTPTISGATLGSNLVLDLVADSFELLTGTRPEKPVLGNDSFYEQAFEGVDISKKEVIEDIKDEKIKEGVILKNANGDELGKAFIVEGENQYGTIKMMVSVQKDSTLGKVIMISNGQSYADKMPNYEQNFKPGMSQSDVDAAPNASGATFGSRLVKDLIKAAIAAAGGAYNDHYKAAFPTIDINKSVELKEFKQKQVLSGIEAKDANGNTLGKAYIVRIENGYSYHIFMVAINDNKLVKVTDVENFHHSDNNSADISEHLQLFKPDMTLEQISNIKYDAMSHATFTIEQIRLGIKVAFAEYGVKEEGTALSDELYIKSIFKLAIWDKTKAIDTSKLAANIIRAYAVEGTEGYNGKSKHIGNVYLVKVQNKYSTYEIFVGINANNTFAGAKVVSYTNNRDLIQPGFLFSDNTPGFVDKYLNSLTNGMTMSEIENHEIVYGLGYTTNLINSAIKIAFNANNSKFKVNESYLYNIEKYYLNTFADISLRHSEVIKGNFKSTNVIEGLIAKDNQGKELGKVYLIESNNIYSHNIILVAINADGTLHNFVDVETDHAELQNLNNTFTSGMNFEAVDKLTTVGGTFSHEQVKEAIKIAMIESGAKDTGILFEQTTKQLYPLMISQKSNRISPKYNTYIKDGFVVRGIEPYGKDVKLLGYTYLLDVDGIKIVVAVNDKLELLFKDNSIILDNKANNNIKDFLNTIKADIKEAEVDSLANIKGDDGTLTNKFKAALKDLLKEVQVNKPLTTYDTFILRAFPEYYSQNSVVIKNFKHAEIVTGVEVKDINNKLLGYSYVIELENVWGEGKNIMLISVKADKTYLGTNGIIDIENHHASMDNQMNRFEGCTDINSVDKVVDEFVKNNDQINNNGGHASGTMSVEMAALGIKIALSEANNTVKPEVRFESIVKVLFSGMIAERSEVITKFTNKEVELGYLVKGVTSANKGLHEQGYAYQVTVTIDTFTATLVFGLSQDKSTIVGIKLVSFEEVNPTNGGNLASKLVEHLEKFANVTFANANSVENSGNFYLDILVSEAIKLIEAETKGQQYNVPATAVDFYKNVYAKAYNNIDITASTFEVVTHNPNILHKVKAVSNTGASLGTGYIVVANNLYSRNYALIMLNDNGTYKGFYELQNDHASFNGSDTEFKEGMTYEEIDKIHVSGGTYTVDEFKLAVKIAMREHLKGDDSLLKEEFALKELFPLAIMQHTKRLQTSGLSTYTYEVRGTKYPANNQLLGYAFNLKLSKLEVLVLRNIDGSLFTSDKSVVILSNTSTATNEEILKFFAQYGANVVSKDKINANTTGLDQALVKEINEALVKFLPLGEKTNEYFFDYYLQQAMPNVSLAITKVLTPKQTEVLGGYELYNIENAKIGYGFIIKLEQKWGEGPNVFLVVLDGEGAFLKFYDIYNNHANVGGTDDIVYAGDKNITDVMESLQGFFNSEHSSGTMSKEIAGLGIMIAMNELASEVNMEVRFESVAKKMYNGMITCKSTKLTQFDDKDFVFGYEVKSADYNGYPVVGNVYFLDANGVKLAVGVNVDGTICKVFNMTNLKEVELEEYRGKTKAEVEALENSEIKTLVLKALGLGGNK